MVDFTNFPEIAAQCAPEIHPTTLSTLVQHESAGNPYAIGVNGNYVLKRQPKTKAEAIKKAKWLQAHGYNFDAGLGQINIRNAKHMGLTIPQLFEPCENLRAASKILTACYTRASSRYNDEQKAVRAALSCYNTGNLSSGLTNGYVKKVIKKVPAITEEDQDLRTQVQLPHSQVVVPNVIIEAPHKKTGVYKKKTMLAKKKAESDSLKGAKKLASED